VTSECPLGAKVYGKASVEVSAVEIIERTVVNISPFQISIGTISFVVPAHKMFPVFLLSFCLLFCIGVKIGL
jgi:hypothetical protein